MPVLVKVRQAPRHLRTPTLLPPFRRQNTSSNLLSRAIIAPRPHQFVTEWTSLSHTRHNSCYVVDFHHATEFFRTEKQKRAMRAKICHSRVRKYCPKQAGSLNVVLVANTKIKLVLSESSDDSECENRIRHQYAMRRRRTTVHEKVLYTRERGNVRDWLDIRAESRSTNLIANATQAPLSVAR